MRFAGFVMTYERPEIIVQTIVKLLDQSSPPEMILVVDNSEGDDTKKVLEDYAHPKVRHHMVGYNAGPAGAASIGLTLLAKEGYDWIYWGDDDDPPKTSDAFAKLFKVIEKSPANTGGVGTIGGYFSPIKVRVSVLKNREINNITEVDQIPGGHGFIVNGKMAFEGILPTPKLFFGFEELDFCIKMKKAGYKLYVDGESLLKSRVKAGNTGANYKWKSKGFGDIDKINRGFYSVRNMNEILMKNGYWIGLLIFFIKNMGKCLIGFKYGWKYGERNIIMIIYAYYCFIFRKFGKIDLDFLVYD